MTKATIDDLGSLHGAVAKSLKRKLEAPLRDNDGLPIDGTEGVAASAAELAVAVGFLKNNGITADGNTNEELAALQEQLKMRRSRRGTIKAAVETATSMLDETIGRLQ